MDLTPSEPAGAKFVRRRADVDRVTVRRGKDLLVHACALSALLALMPSGASAQPALTPRRAFFGQPDQSNHRISPDGRMLGWLASGERRRLVVRMTDRPDAAPVPILDAEAIIDWSWARNDEQVICTVRDADGRTRLRATDVIVGYDIALDGSVSSTVMGPGATIDLTPDGAKTCRALASSDRLPDELLVTADTREEGREDVWWVNTRTGEAELIFPNDHRFAGFLADGDLAVRVAWRFNSRGGLDALANDERGSWYELARWDADEAVNSRPLAISPDGETILIADARRTDAAALYAFENGGPGGSRYRRLMHETGADVTDILLDPESGAALTVELGGLFPKWRPVDDRITAKLIGLSAFGEGEPEIVSRSRDGRRWIVHLHSGAAPTRHFLYDTRTGEATLLGAERSMPPTFSANAMQAIRIRARDGLQLPVYLTSPRDVGEGPFPTVVLIHDALDRRAPRRFSPLHQWLSDRGYAVLEIVPRGGAGFGAAFAAAGFGEWAGAVQNDVIDAVLWAVDAGVTHPDRVAAVGEGLGGFVVFAAMTYTPEFFACGVTLNGVSDLAAFIADPPPALRAREPAIRARLAGASASRRLADNSPLARAGDVQRPLLIAYDEQNRLVSPSQSRQFIDALRNAGRPVVSMRFPQTGRDFVSSANPLAFATAVENFLSRHIGGRFQPAGDDIENADVEAQGGALLSPAE